MQKNNWAYSWDSTAKWLLSFPWSKFARASQWAGFSLAFKKVLNRVFLQTKVSSLEAEKCKQNEKVKELQKSNPKPTADKPKDKPLEKKTTDVKEKPSLS